MSAADTLRAAATQMRENADVATPGRWDWYGDHLVWPSDQGPAANDPVIAVIGEAHTDCSAHIASWDPTVAVAVAELLENEASLIDSTEEYPDLHAPINGARVGLLLTIARTFLGGDA